MDYLSNFSYALFLILITLIGAISWTTFIDLLWKSVHTCYIYRRKTFIIWEINLIYNSSRNKLNVYCLLDLKNASLCFSNLACFTFLEQKISLWSDTAQSIILNWRIFLVQFARKWWSMREEVLHVTYVGQVTSYFK